MASQSGHNDTGLSSPVELGDLPSKRLLGKGLASIGYETEVNGGRFARKDFIGVPSFLFEEEAAVLVGLEDHKNIVKTLGWTVDKTSCSLVVEYVDENLLGLLRKRKQSQGNCPIGADESDNEHFTPPFELPEAVDIMLQIASGMEYLHDHGILHGHLKTKNILVTSNGDQSNSLSVKVADFGLVRTKRTSMPFVSRQARKRDMVRWKAPEILEADLLLSKHRDDTSSESDSDESSTVGSRSCVINWRQLSADVYSFAVICSQILTGEDPYPNDLNWKEWGADIVAGEVRPTLPAACPPELRTLLNSCWGMISPESSLRPTFSYIRRALEHLVPSRQIMALGEPHQYLDQSFGPADEVMVVTDLINSVIKETRTKSWTLSYEDLQNLRGELDVIQPDVVKIEVQLWVLRKKNLYMVEQYSESAVEQYSVKMVEAWLKTLQHALHLTVSELRRTYPGKTSHYLEPVGSSLMSMKILEHVKEINVLAKNREEMHLQLTNLLSHHSRSMREEQFKLSNLMIREGQFRHLHETPSSVLSVALQEMFFELLNKRDQEILMKQFRVLRRLRPREKRREAKAKLPEPLVGRLSYGSWPDRSGRPHSVSSHASSGRPYSVDRSSYASSGRPYSVDPLSSDFEHPTRETPSNSTEFQTSTTAGMGAPHHVHDTQQAMIRHMLDEGEREPWPRMDMDASLETGDVTMLDSSGLVLKIVSPKMLLQATSSRSSGEPFKAWRRAPVVPRRSEGSTHQCLLRRGFEFLRHIPRVEADAKLWPEHDLFDEDASHKAAAEEWAIDEEWTIDEAPNAIDEEWTIVKATEEWAIDEAPNGKPFYLNLITGATQWEKPAALETHNYPQVGPSRIGPPGHPDHHEVAGHHMMKERVRRKKQKDNFSPLRKLVPIISKHDKASILGDAIIYPNNLQARIQELEANMAETASQYEKLKLSHQRLQERNKQLEAMVSVTGPVLNP